MSFVQNNTVQPEIWLASPNSRGPRTTHSMYQTPTATALHVPMRRTVTSPPVYHSAPSIYCKTSPVYHNASPVYAPNQNILYGAPPVPQMYATPPPHVSAYGMNNTSMYYPPPVPQPQVLLQQTQLPPSYGDFDQNYEVHFGPDVRPLELSPIQQQREQLNNFERNKQRTYNSNTPTISTAEARALKEAIQLSLTECNPRGGGSSRADSNTGDFESGCTTQTHSSRSSHDRRFTPDTNSSGRRDLTPEELADEKALQEAILASILEAEQQEQRCFPVVPPSPATLVRASENEVTYRYEHAQAQVPVQAQAQVSPTPPADRQYPYNLDSHGRGFNSSERLRRRQEEFCTASFYEAHEERDHNEPARHTAYKEYRSPNAGTLQRSYTREEDPRLTARPATSSDHDHVQELVVESHFPFSQAQAQPARQRSASVTRGRCFERVVLPADSEDSDVPRSARGATRSPPPGARMVPLRRGVSVPRLVNMPVAYAPAGGCMPSGFHSDRSRGSSSVVTAPPSYREPPSYPPSLASSRQNTARSVPESHTRTEDEPAYPAKAVSRVLPPPPVFRQAGQRFPVRDGKRQ